MNEDIKRESIAKSRELVLGKIYEMLGLDKDLAYKLPTAGTVFDVEVKRKGMASLTDLVGQKIYLSLKFLDKSQNVFTVGGVTTITSLSADLSGFMFDVSPLFFHLKRGDTLVGNIIIQRFFLGDIEGHALKPLTVPELTAGDDEEYEPIIGDIPETDYSIVHAVVMIVS